MPALAAQLRAFVKSFPLPPQAPSEEKPFQKQGIGYRRCVMSGLDASPPRPSRVKVRMSSCLVTVISRAGKTAISRINLLPPAPAAPYGLASYGICRQFPHPLSRKRKPSSNTTGQRMMPASTGSVPDPHLPPDGRAGVYTYMMVRKSWPDFLGGPSELPLCLRLIKYLDTLYFYPCRQGIFP